MTFSDQPPRHLRQSVGHRLAPQWGIAQVGRGQYHVLVVSQASRSPFNCPLDRCGIAFQTPWGGSDDGGAPPLGNFHLAGGARMAAAGYHQNWAIGAGWDGRVRGFVSWGRQDLAQRPRQPGRAAP